MLYMPTKRCLICEQYKTMDERSVCCAACEETELDLLIAVYAFIHCSGNEYIQGKDLINNLGRVRDITLNSIFLRSWITRKWLDRNEVDAVRVPKPIQEDLKEGGFSVTPEILHTLECLKENKPKYDKNLMKTDFQKEDPQGKFRMAYHSRKR